MFIFSAFSADTLFIVCFLHLPAHVAIQTHIGFFQCKLLVLQTPLTLLFNMLYISQLSLIKDWNMFASVGQWLQHIITSKFRVSIFRLYIWEDRKVYASNWSILSYLMFQLKHLKKLHTCIPVIIYIVLYFLLILL